LVDPVSVLGARAALESAAGPCKSMPLPQAALQPQACWHAAGAAGARQPQDSR
jgi:hypothetical protein